MDAGRRATHDRHGGRRGIAVHRSDIRDRADHLRVARLPVTSVARTLLDLAPGLSDAKLEPLVDQSLRLTSRAKILTTIERHPRRPGTPRLRALMTGDRPSADTGPGPRRVCAPRSSAPACPLRSRTSRSAATSDLLWREPRLIVEYDSYLLHSQPGVFHNDRTRHNDLEVHHGYRVLHVTRRQVIDELSRVLVWIALALADH